MRSTNQVYLITILLYNHASAHCPWQSCYRQVERSYRPSMFSASSRVLVMWVLQLSAKAVRVSYGMVYLKFWATKQTTKTGKASLAETFFQKLFGKRRAVRIEGSGSGFGVGARFLGVGSIFGWILGSGPIIRFWRGFAIFQLFSI